METPPMPFFPNAPLGWRPDSGANSGPFYAVPLGVRMPDNPPPVDDTIKVYPLGIRMPDHAPPVDDTIEVYPLGIRVDDPYDFYPPDDHLIDVQPLGMPIDRRYQPPPPPLPYGRSLFNAFTNLQAIMQRLFGFFGGGRYPR